MQVPLFIEDAAAEERRADLEAARCEKVLDYLGELRAAGYDATYAEVYDLVYGEDLPF